jgi:uncharacterized protein DUF4349
MNRRWISRTAGGVAFLAVAVVGLAACGGGVPEQATGAAPSSATGPDQPQIGPGQPDASVERKVVVTTTLELQVQKIAAAYAEVSRLAKAAGGFIADSTVSGDDRAGSATVRLRVPASEHDDVVSGLRALSSRVVRESTNAKEVTDQYTDLQARLVNLQRNEAQYQTLLGQAKTLDEVLNVNSRLESVRGDIEQTQGRINLLDNLADFATINVSMSLPPVASRAHQPTPVQILVGAWHVSEQVANGLANLTVVLGVALVWLLPFGALGIGSWRLGRRLAPVARRLLG